MPVIECDEWGTVTVRKGSLIVLLMYREAWLCWYGIGVIGRVKVGLA